MKRLEPPEILNQIVDKVLAYRPKPKSKGANIFFFKQKTAYEITR